MDKRRRLRVLHVGTRITIVGIAIAVVVITQGWAKPFISLSQVPFGIVGLLLAATIIATVLESVPKRLLVKRYWTATGTEAGLTPQDEGLLTPPTFTDTVQGRHIRVTTGRENLSSGGSANTKNQRTVPYIAVEAKLAASGDAGVLIGPAEQEAFVTPYNVAPFSDTRTDGLVAAGTSEGLATAVLTDQVRSALDAIDDQNQVYVDNAKAVADRFPDDERSPADTSPAQTTKINMAHQEAKASGDWLGGPGWVSHVQERKSFDSASIRQQVKAVTTIANAYEDVTSAHETPRTADIG